jgi:hypothetical protein
MTGLSMEGMVLGLLGAASAAVVKFMSDLMSCLCRAEAAVRAGGASSSSAPERRAGSKMSPPPPPDPRAAADVAALSPLASLTPPSCAPHDIVKFRNPPVNISFIDGGCAVAIVVAPVIDGVGILREDGIANVRCPAVTAAARR